MVRGMLTSGGHPVVVDDAEVLRAHALGHRTVRSPSPPPLLAAPSVVLSAALFPLPLLATPRPFCRESSVLCSAPPASAAEQVGADVCHTGASGLAGLLAERASGAVPAGESHLVIFTGRTRE